MAQSRLHVGHVCGIETIISHSRSLVIMAQFSVKRPVVLIVEDEPLIRLNACNMLKDDGFEVIGAASAHEAIQILETRSDICLIFTDVQMPGTMDGLALVRMARDRWPPIKIVVTSGDPPVTGGTRGVN